VHYVSLIYALSALLPVLLLLASAAKLSNHWQQLLAGFKFGHNGIDQG
jgi:hypothetical protein